jgi:hypothetical protein
MRIVMIAAAATLLLLPAAAPANACGATHTAKAAATDYSAAKHKKPVKKKEKVEYMRAVPMK